MRVLAEVEAAELAELDQPGDDHFDVHVGGVMAEVDEAVGLRPEFGGDDVECPSMYLKAGDDLRRAGRCRSAF